MSGALVRTLDAANQWTLRGAQQHKGGQVVVDQYDDSGRVYRGHATILFSDLCGSTTLGELLDPEILAEVLRQVRHAAEAVISRYRGVVTQFYGDGILAVFGFPSPAEGDARRALEAALSLHETIATLPLDGLLPAGFCVRLHSGVHAGLVAIQQGDFVQGRYKVFGDALNTAARLSSCADTDQIVVCTRSMQGVLPFFITQAMPPAVLKGKAERLDACCVLGRSTVNTHFEARSCRGLTPFHGRVRELQLIERSLQAARRGRLQLVSVMGDAGLGKTRLVDVFLQQLDNTHVTVLRAYCHTDGGVIPLLPFLQLLQKLFRIDHETRDADIPQHIESVMNGLTPTMPAWVRDLTHMLSTSRTAAQTPSDSAAVIVALLRLLATHQPLIIFIDDWHGADDMSRQVVSELIASARDSALLLITTARTLDVMNPVGSGSLVKLAPLPLQDSTTLIETLLPRQPEIGFTAQIHEQAGGNPLFIEELCQSLHDRMQQSHRSKSAAMTSVWNAAWNGDAGTTLNELIETRANRLPPEQLELVRIAAIIGPVFSLSLLQRTLQCVISAATIAALVQADLVHETSSENEYRFKHGITHHVITGSIPLQMRQQLHARIAQLLEQDCNSGIHVHSETLAHHFRGAGIRDKAIFYAESAGDKALVTSSLDSARQQYAIALSLLRGNTISAADKQKWISICKRWALACTYSPAREQLNILQQAALFAEELNDTAALADAQYWMGWINYALGDQNTSIAHYKKAFAIAKKSSDEKTTTQIMTTLGQSYAAAGHYPQALALLSEALAIKEQHRGGRASVPVGSAFGKTCKAFVLADMGEFDTAIMLIDSALIGLKGHSQAIEGSILTLYAAMLLWRGDWHRAFELAKQAQRIAEHVNGPYVYAMSQAVQGYARWRMVHGTDALDALRQATQWLEQRDMCLYISLAYGWLADALAADGNFIEAKKYAFAAIEREKFGDNVGIAMAYRALAMIAHNSNDADLQSAESYLDKAMENAQRRNSAHEIALTQMQQVQWLLTRADWHSGAQDRIRADMLATSAQRALGEMGMTGMLANV